MAGRAHPRAAECVKAMREPGQGDGSGLVDGGDQLRSVHLSAPTPCNRLCPGGKRTMRKKRSCGDFGSQAKDQRTELEECVQRETGGRRLEQ